MLFIHKNKSKNFKIKDTNKVRNLYKNDLLIFFNILNFIIFLNLFIFF